MCVGEDRVVLWLHRSKTDQRGKGVSVQLFTLPGSWVCPVRVVRKFLGGSPAGSGQFLLHRDGS